MNQKPKNCIECRKIPQHLFFLSCAHPLCLLCSSNLAQALTKYQYCIICPKCQQETELTQQLYQELNQQQYNQIKQAKTNKINNNEQSKAYPCINDPNLQKYLVQIEQEPFQRYCQDHNEFAVLYVCKSCNNRLICPECAINGLHKNHEVVGIQKQGQKIKQKVHRQLGSLNSKITQLKHLQSTRLAMIKERINQLQRLKSVAKEQYDQIRNSLNQEERVVISKCNELILIHTQQQTNFKQEISNQLANYQQTRSNIISLLNPFVKQSILETNKLFQKMCYINLISQYNHYSIEQHNRPCFNNKFYNEEEIRNNFKKIVNRIQKFKVQSVKENIYSQIGSKDHKPNLKLQGLYNQRYLNDEPKKVKSGYSSYIPKKNDYFNLL